MLVTLAIQLALMTYLLAVAGTAAAQVIGGVLIGILFLVLCVSLVRAPFRWLVDERGIHLRKLLGWQRIGWAQVVLIEFETIDVNEHRKNHKTHGRNWVYWRGSKRWIHILSAPYAHHCLRQRIADGTLPTLHRTIYPQESPNKLWLRRLNEEQANLRVRQATPARELRD
ncbi:MAG: hypothetical protein AAGG07_07365 [Planctomycetota bacterium]